MFISSGYTFAQNAINEALGSIENNNTTLKALRYGVEAGKLENKTGNTLENPDVEFNYLWGKPSSIGNRKNFNVKQSFDLPTIFGAKSALAGKLNVLLDLKYRTERINILLQAKKICIELIYYNALLSEMQKRLQYAQTLANAYAKRFDIGDANIIEYNKSQMNLSMLKNELSRIEIERLSLIQTLTQLNGGKEIMLMETNYLNKTMPPDFETWYAYAQTKNPMLEYVKIDIEANKQYVKLSKLSGLPKFSAGYMSELLSHDKFRGVSFGISLPLWENKNRVKHAKASMHAAQSRSEDTRIQFYSQLKNTYNKTIALHENASRYRQTLAKTSNASLLQKTLDAGEISLLDYIVELGLYYQVIDNALAAERDYELSRAELEASEL